MNGMGLWQTADPDLGITPVVTHVVANHRCADVLAEVVRLKAAAQAVRMMCIATSAEDSSVPVGNAQRCRL